MTTEQGPWPRLAVMDWGHHWLARPTQNRDSRQQLDTLLAEVRARGFNTLALDPCPHLIAAPAAGLHLDRFELTSEPLAPHGNPAPSGVITPRAALRELLEAARDQQLRVWLSTSLLPDTQARRSFVRRPRDFIRIWSETLDFIRQEGLTETVQAVDIYREFPAPPAGWGAYRSIFQHHPRNPLPLNLRWSRAVAQRAEAYLLEIPRALRAAFPRHYYGISTNRSLLRHLRQLDTSELDFLDYHLWLDDDRNFQLATGSAVPRPSGRLTERLQGSVSYLAWRARRGHWQNRLAERLEEFHELCRLRRLEPTLTSGFVRTGPENRDTRLVHELGEWAVSQGLVEGLNVLCPASQARPEEPALWQQQHWLETQNQRIRGADPESPD